MAAKINVFTSSKSTGQLEACFITTPFPFTLQVILTCGVSPLIFPVLENQLPKPGKGKLMRMPLLRWWI
jgi:hypothetical protein